MHGTKTLNIFTDFFVDELFFYVYWISKKSYELMEEVINLQQATERDILH